jgi:membrane associated rhomboid family serine protease
VLILPLHRAPTRANFPWATLGLVLANLFVFFALQSGDARRQQDALDHYVDAGLARWEFPAYRDWLATQADVDGRGELFEHFAQGAEPRFAARILQSDEDFLAALRADRLVTPQADGYADWRARREAFERLWDMAFTERWKLRFSAIEPGRMVGAMFLHGGVGHLFGNLLFLAVLGLLVEGALGPLLFLAVYLLGGLGSAALSLAWRWGDAGAALGASGAIAALMGAYCVLWGRRKVRFFWWFFVVFDYVKAPALVLLPFWLGWELVNLAWNKGAHIGFDAHAGGIMAGAMLALGVRALRWERRAFLDEDEVADAAAADRTALAQAQQHLGRLELAAARALLEPLAARRPDDFGVLVALYRCARYEPRLPNLDAAALAVLERAPRDAGETREQKAVFDDYRAASGGRLRLSASQLVALARRWPAIGAGGDALALLVTVSERAPATPGLPAACLALARDLRARGEAAGAQRLLERTVATWPDSVEAGKARVLQADGS